MSCVCIGGGGGVVKGRQIGKWVCPVMLRWFPVMCLCRLHLLLCRCGVYIYDVGDCVCGEKFVVVVELCRRRRKMRSVYVFGCDIHCRSFSIHIYQSLL